jgi:hypothetical protein
MVNTKCGGYWKYCVECTKQKEKSIDVITKLNIERTVSGINCIVEWEDIHGKPHFKKLNGRDTKAIFNYIKDYIYD